MKTHDFYYDLPEELIAQTPLEQRDTSRLLKLDRVSGEIVHQHFYDIIDHLRPGDCLVMNDSRVLPARLLGHRPTGGAVEVLLLRDLGNKKWECLCKPGRKMQVGNQVIFGNGELTATVVEVQETGNRVVESTTRVFSWKCWSGLAKCLCRLTSRKNSRTRSVTRPFIPRPSALPQRLQRACIGPMSCWRRPGPRGSGLHS